MSDLFVLLLAPAGGDELQGVKRGIMEIADLILVNKADGELRAAATRTCADYAGALKLLRKRPQDPEGFPKALMVSALAEDGLGEAWAEMRRLAEWRKAESHWSRRRAEQARGWFEYEVRQGLLARLTADPALRDRMTRLGDRVAAGDTAVTAAAEEMLRALGAGSPPAPDAG
jgi:LAO/AO transport system kinase